MKQVDNSAIHKKMYKSGKQWIVAGLLLSGSLFLSAHVSEETVHADAEPQTNQVTTIKPDPNKQVVIPSGNNTTGQDSPSQAVQKPAPAIKEIVVNGRSTPVEQEQTHLAQGLSNLSETINENKGQVKDAQPTPDLTRTITETVHYRDSNGKMLAPDRTDSVVFNRTASNSNGNNGTYSDWSATNGKTSFNAIQSPVINGYVTNLAQIDPVSGVTADTQSFEKTVSYQPLGRVITQVGDNKELKFVPAQPTQYTNLPNDPTKVAPVFPPDISGFTPVAVNGQSINIRNAITIAVTDPTKDMVITYNENKVLVLVNTITLVNGDPNNTVTKTISSDNYYHGEKYHVVAPQQDGYYVYGMVSNATGLPAADLTPADKALAHFGNTGGIIDQPVGSILIAFFYKPLGHLKVRSSITNDPNFPVIATIQYSSNPDNPTQGLITVPTVPGYQAAAPDKPFLAAGSKYQPVDPEQDTTLLYSPIDYTITSNYVDQDGKTLVPADTQSAKHIGDAYQTSAKVIDGYYLIKQPDNRQGTVGAGDVTVNYVYAPFAGVNISSTTPDDPHFPKNVPVSYVPDSSDPTRGTVIVPSIPGYQAVVDNTSVAPGSPIAVGDPSKPVTINYFPIDYILTTKFVDQSGNEIAPATLDGARHVGQSYQATPKVIRGYYLLTTPSNASGTFGAQAITVTFTYGKLGHVTISSADPNDPHFPGVAPITYVNDSSDPSKSDGITIPVVTGYTPYDQQGNPLVPGTKFTPTTVDADTSISYRANDENASVTYFDDTDKTTIREDPLTGKFGTTADYRTQNRINILIQDGYLLVSDDYPTNGVVFNQDGVVQKFNVHLVHNIIKLTKDTKLPVDIVGTRLGEQPEVAPLAKTVTQTINYVYADGSIAHPAFVSAINFDRGGSYDAVSEELSYEDWRAEPADSEFAAQPSPVISGYAASALESQPVTGVTEDSPDNSQTITYRKLTSVTFAPGDPKDPNWPGIPAAEYVNDPADPSKVLGVKVPDVPGYQPVDQNDKPIAVGTDFIPSDPTVSSTITYQPIDYQLVTTFVDSQGKDLQPAVTTTGHHIGETYTTKPATIVGYYLLSVPQNANGKFGAENQAVVYKYGQTGKLTIQSNEIGDSHFPTIPSPSYVATPDDPTKVSVIVPDVPGYLPYGPDGQLLQPGSVFTPTDAASDTPISYHPIDYALKVSYVDANGKEIAPSSQKTGNHIGDVYTIDALPIVDYSLTDANAHITGTFGAGDVAITFHYQAIPKSKSRVGEPIATKSQIGSPVATRSQIGSSVATRSRVGEPLSAEAKSKSRVGEPIAAKNQVGSSVAQGSRVANPIATRNQIGSSVATRSRIGDSVAKGSRVGNPLSESAKRYEHVGEPIATKSQIGLSVAKGSRVGQPLSKDVETRTRLDEPLVVQVEDDMSVGKKDKVDLSTTSTAQGQTSGLSTNQSFNGLSRSNRVSGKLPNTNERSEGALQLIGTGLLSLLGLLGLRKKRD